ITPLIPGIRLRSKQRGAQFVIGRQLPAALHQNAKGFGCDPTMILKSGYAEKPSYFAPSELKTDWTIVPGALPRALLLLPFAQKLPFRQRKWDPGCKSPFPCLSAVHHDSVKVADAVRV